MKAAQEFLKEQEIAEIESWAVTGISKRGWLCLLVAATECKGCGVNIGAITPINPIVPNLLHDVHRQWQAYDGFTWAFSDYIEANLTTIFDSEKMAKAWDIIDPINFVERMENIPKFVTVSSDDEFMMMDWTSMYWDKITGEKHLLIAPNTEHFMVTGIFDVMSSMGSNIRSVMMGIKKRPTFTHSYDKETGAISITIPKDQEQPFMVSLRHG